MITKKQFQNLIAAISFTTSIVSCGPSEEKESQVNTTSNQSMPSDQEGKDEEQESKLITEIVAESEELSTLLQAVVSADLVDVLGNEEGAFTLFAPTNKAFASLPDGVLEDLLRPENKKKLTDILTFHVVANNLMASQVLSMDSLSTIFGQHLSVDSKNARVNDVNITKTDIKARNGTIHLIDQVLLPKTILELAESAGFSTLIAALDAAGLKDTLNGDGPFTVFAPTDEAFAKLPEGTLSSLLQPENKNDLTNILTYHVASGSFNAEQVLGFAMIDTIGGQSIAIDADEVKANESKIIATDIIGSNGVIHVIDAILMPE